MVNDFLDNLGARQHRKMTERNASKEEITNTCEKNHDKKDLYEGIWDKYYNSESEGKDFKDAFYAPEEWGIWQTSKYGEEYDEKFWEEYNKTQNKKET